MKQLGEKIGHRHHGNDPGDETKGGRAYERRRAFARESTEPEVIELNEAEFEAVKRALEAPQEPTPALKKLLGRWRRWVDDALEFSSRSWP